MDCMSLLTHIHRILNLWVDDERAILYDICRLQRMIQDHVLPGPITGIPLAFTNPKQSLLPDMTLLFLCLKEHTRTHTQMFIWLINLFFLWLQKNGHSLSHAGGRDDAQISNSKETKSSDLDISLCQNASGLFSQLKYERDRQEEKGKTK